MSDTTNTEAQDTPNADEQAQGGAEQANTEAQDTPETGDQADVEALKAEVESLKAYTEKLKTENAGKRVKERETGEQLAALKAQILAAFGDGEDDADPEEALKAARAEAQEAQAKLADYERDTILTRVARETGADPDLMVPFLKGTGGLPEWGADDYADQVKALITDTLKARPALGVRHAPTSSGQAPTPTKSTPGMLSRQDLKDMAKAGKWREINQAYADGRVQE